MKRTRRRHHDAARLWSHVKSQLGSAAITVGPDTSQSRLQGRRWGRVFSLAQRLSLRLVEADGLTGSLVAEVVGEIEPSSFENLRPESQKSRSKSAAKSTRKKSNARRKYQRR